MNVAPFDVRLPDGDEADEAVAKVVQPDITVVCDPFKLDERGCRGAPDWIIEVLSPTSAGHDQVRKLALYERHGVREYWLAHPDDRIVTVYRLERGAYGRPLVMRWRAAWHRPPVPRWKSTGRGWSRACLDRTQAQTQNHDGDANAGSYWVVPVGGVQCFLQASDSVKITRPAAVPGRRRTSGTPSPRSVTGAGLSRAAPIGPPSMTFGLVFPCRLTPNRPIAGPRIAGVGAIDPRSFTRSSSSPHGHSR